LAHPYLAQFHVPQKEATAAACVQMGLRDSEKHTVRDYRNQIYKEAVVPAETGTRRSRLIKTIH
jgi:mitogen-activated protein kinase 15